MLPILFSRRIDFMKDRDSLGLPNSFGKRKVISGGKCLELFPTMKPECDRNLLQNLDDEFKFHKQC